MMKLLCMFFALILWHLSFAQDNASSPFSSLKTDSVVLYDFNARMKPAVSIIDKTNGTLSTTVIKSKKLDFKTAKMLSSKIESKSSYGQGVAACFDPHLGIVYYSQGKAVAYINICIGCNQLKSNLKISAQDQGKQISEEGDEYYTFYGMSKPFRNYLNKMLKKYKFSHQILPNSLFD